MKPKQLKKAYKWEDRVPLFNSNIFYVPEFYFKHSEFQFPSFEEIFKNTNPVNIEICSGNGDWIIEKAKLNPDTNWIAVEIRFDRVRKIWSKASNENVKNLLIVYGEGLCFLQNYLKNECINDIFINFPDPWPKLRHAKNRLISTTFINEASRVLNSQGNLILVSDDVPYISNSATITYQSKLLIPEYKEPYFINTQDLSNYGSSWFYNLWISKGRQVFTMSFKKP